MRMMLGLAVTALTGVLASHDVKAQAPTECDGSVQRCNLHDGREEVAGVLGAQRG